MPLPERTSIAKAPTGIAGLDAALYGGVPRGRTTLLIGGPGTGKTVLALQFLVNGHTQGEPGLLVSFEESPAAFIENAATFAWFPQQAAMRPLLIDGRVPDETIETGNFDLRGLIAVLDAQVVRHGTKRLVLDGLDALFLTHAQDGGNRRELLRLLRWLETAGLTAIVTLKPSGAGEVLSPQFEYAEYMANAVVRLESRSIARLVQRSLRVVKLRGGGFAAGEHPFLISSNGIEVAYTDLIKVAASDSTERESTGIDRLDRMMEGGLRSGTVTLISGLPGTAKTTIGGAFLEAGLGRGERALLVGFDEPADQMIFDLQSVGIRLARYRESGLLHTATFNASAAIADEHFIAIERLVREHNPRLLVIDPISALTKAGGPVVADLVAERIVELVKARGITAIFTALSVREIGDSEDTNTHVSSVADTWIHLSYSVRRGERNRTLTIIKSRGTEHSNQMRELLITREGVTLEDVYVAEGDVLLGTARIEREQHDVTDQEVRAHHLQAELRGLEIKKALAETRIRAAELDVLESGAYIEDLLARTAMIERTEAKQREVRLQSRRADEPVASNHESEAR